MKKRIVIISLSIMACALILMTGCGNKKSTESAPESTPVATEDISEALGTTQDMIIIGHLDENDPNSSILYFYNLNCCNSVDELAEYVDITYDFEKKPEILLGNADAPAEVLQQVKDMLDSKQVVYQVFDDGTNS